VTDRPILCLLHGPNLNLLGQREPHIYGTATLEDYVTAVTAAADRFGMTVEAHQSNHEGVLIEAIHAARERCAAVLINPGAFTHYSWAIHDALAAFSGPILEVHISNPNAREAWRHTSVVSPVATGTIVGLGMQGYELAVQAIARQLGCG
jgi:3-dehydroquinate dehydratase-2